jgi:microcystin-dependent protein
MPLQFIITDAGRAAIAQVGGAIGPVTLTKIAIGSAGYTPLANRTALQTEIKRIDPSGSSVPVPGTISITAQDNSADSYSVKEIGLYTNNNVLFAVYSQTGVIMTKASGSAALFAMDFVMTNVPAGTVTVGNVGFTYSQATETAMGVLGIATTAEAQAGIINTKIITPLRLAEVTATETRKGVIALANTTEAQALAPDATKALTVARLLDRTATTSRAGVVTLATNAQTQTGTDATRAVTPASLASAASLLVPPGAVLPFASAVTPSGWLAANGNVVPNGIGTVQGVTANFAALFAVVGTTYGAAGTLPDLRGYFVRGSGTNSDGMASGTFGQKQADAFKSHSHTGSTGAGGDHTHTASTNTAGNHSHGYSAPNSYQQDTTNSPAHGKRATSNANLNTSAAGDHSHTVTIGAAGNHSHTVTIGAEGGTETRPKNIALLYCIKF